MKRQKILLNIFFLCLSVLGFAQNNYIDSLKLLVSKAGNDTNKVKNLLLLSKEYISTSPDDAIKYSNEAKDLSEQLQYTAGLAFAQKNIGMVYYNQTKYVETIEHWTQSYLLFDSIGDKINEALLLNNIGSVYMNQGDDPKALEYYFKSLQIAEQSHDDHKKAMALGNIGTIYSNNKFTYDKAIDYYLKALTLSEKFNDKNITGGLLVNIGETYMNRNKDDSALYYFKKSLDAYANTENIPYSLNDIGKIYTREGNYAMAKSYHEQALAFAKKLELQLDIAQSYLGLATNYFKNGKYSNALDAYKNAEATANKINLKRELRDAYHGLALTYAALKDFSQAFTYQTLFTNIKDTLFNLDVAQKVNNLQTNFDIQKKQGQIDILTRDQSLQKLEISRQKFVRNTFAFSLVFVFIIMFILYKLYRKVKRRTIQLRRSLEELKSAQTQLIQSEKMASLGELTVGIAHEIQNPLNFVNNFSEVNTELVEEMREEIKKGNIEEVNAISDAIRDNQQKITHHGKRADAIVKNMLQHSRVNKGESELVDINALADEYLRLSYQGFRSKDKSLPGGQAAFNATIQTNFDSKIGKTSIIPQDIGRVFLNFFNNAFYAMNEKKKQSAGEYTPIISVSTKKLTDKSHNYRVEIRVKDNGVGIPREILDKIYLPFFTTKPTGEGTGLGLSISYDIIKSHGGELKLNTKEGEFTEFIIKL